MVREIDGGLCTPEISIKFKKLKLLRERKGERRGNPRTPDPNLMFDELSVRLIVWMIDVLSTM